MIKKIFLLILCLFSASSAFATTQYYYLSPTGAGSNSGDTGTWNTVPTTVANAMSASNFNDPGNWSTSDSASKLDPDDVVYPKGIWSSEAYNLTPVMGITLDFYENGDFDPVNGDKTIEPVFRNTRINAWVNNVKIYDGRFGYDGGDGRYVAAPYTIHAAPTSPSHKKITGLEIKRNAFYGSFYVDSPSVYFGFVCDSEVVGNWFKSYHANWDASVPCYGRSRFFAMHAGSRNKINSNSIDGGFTGPILIHKRDWNVDGKVDIPSSGAYAIDPDGNMENNEIAYNHIVRRCEEGITSDPGHEPEAIPTVERDTVASISGNKLTLSHSGWAAAGNRYSGFYMISVDDEDGSFGRHAMIRSQDNATFTFADNVSTLFPGLDPGDYIIISLVLRHNWIHHNTYAGSGYVGFATDAILFEGVTLENLIENNSMDAIAYSPGLSVTTRSLHSLNQSSGSITQTYGNTLSAFNIIRGNSCYGLIEMVYDKSAVHSGRTPWPFINRNNAYYNNTLSYGLTLNNCHVYVSNNSKGVVATGANVKILQSDPTVHVSQYFSNWGSNKLNALVPPNGVQISIIQ